MKVYIVENAGNTIKCELQKRRNSKNIKIRVDESGLVKVSLPNYTPYIFAKNFVNKNLTWIEKKLSLSESKKNKYYYLGKNIRFIKKDSAYYKSFNYILNNSELTIETNCSLSTDEEIFTEWLMQMANEYIPRKTAEIAKKYGFMYNSLKIKNLTSRWGSCSSKKNLSFNLKLMQFDYNTIDYVIVHELCHLREMNHSKKFWDLVREIIPNYKEYRSNLNKLNHKKP